MDYFSKFLRPAAHASPKQQHDHAAEFHKSWTIVKDTLTHPDERQLARGVTSTNVPAALKSMVDALVWESTRTEEGGTGACMEYLLKEDVLGQLVRLSEADRPSGIQAEVLRTVQNMVVLLDEQFLVHSAVHRAVLRLLRTCVGDDIQEQLDGRNRVMGAARNSARTSPSEYEEDLVDLLCLLCSRIRTFRELLMIFFYDKQWYHSAHPHATPEDDEDEDEDEGHGDDDAKHDAATSLARSTSPTPSQETVTSAPVSSAKKPEYEFILFNYLLRFVHREGKIGDFARAGLLFLMDVAMSPGVPIHRLAGDEESRQPTLTSQATAPDPITDAALALAEYILDGDFCEVLAAGLGAVYSMLPSKLEICPEPSGAGSQNNGMIIGGTGPMSDEEKERVEVAREKARALGMEYSTNPDFRARLDHFVKLLEFLQDILKRNESQDADEVTVDPSSLVGSAIVQTILDAVRRIFLENVLYPAILECSDTDGSAVAVMSYIDVMVRALHDQQFVEMLIDFLASEDDTESTRRRSRTQSTLNLDGPRQGPQTPTEEAKRTRRKSSAMMLLEMEAPDAKRQSEYVTSLGRFTIKDLLLTSFRSSTYQAVTVALTLLQSLLGQHCEIVVEQLFIVAREVPPAGTRRQLPTKQEVEDEDEETFVYPDGGEEQPKPRQQTSFSSPELVLEVPVTSYAMHQREMDMYLALVSRIDPTHRQGGAFSTGYDYYLQDALASITNHDCFAFYGDVPAPRRPKHLLSPNDPLLSPVLQALRRFFSNSPELNIALTGVLATLASCPDRSLAGWLLFGHSPEATQAPANGTDQMLPHFADDGDDRSVDFAIEERLGQGGDPLPPPIVDTRSYPVIYSILQGLVANLDKLRKSVHRFDDCLSQRRQGLVFSENLTDALNLSFDLSSDVIAAGNVDGAKTARTDSAPETPPAKPKPKSKSSGWSSLLSPRKKSAEAKQSPTPLGAGSSPNSKAKEIDARPFGAHYQETNSMIVEPLIAPIPTTSSWMPSSRQQYAVDEDAFGTHGQWNDGRRLAVPAAPNDPEDDRLASKPVTLSHLLDNVVILEECIKELVAVIHARRTLGVDSVRYL